MFTEHDKRSKTPFILNILMDKAQEDLHDIINKTKDKTMNMD